MRKESSLTVAVARRYGKGRRGTSLVEVLVVIVIFLIGILAVLQIFPGGLRILGNSRNATIATAAAADESERLKTRAAQMPEQIIPVKLVYEGPRVRIIADPDRRTSDLGPLAEGMNGSGILVDTNGDPLGDWKLATGSNSIKRVVGEGSRVPAPRQIGALYGGLMVLQFAPIVSSVNYSDPSLGAASLLSVYGNDLRRIEGAPSEQGNEGYEYFVENPNTDEATLHFEADPLKDRSYRVSLSAYVNSGGTVEKRDYVDVDITVPAQTGFYAVPLKEGGLDPLALGADALESVEFDTVRAARQYEEVVGFTSDPYEYVVLNEDLGSLLFNPAAYSYFVRDAGGRRVPLQARVSYNVLDWRIIRDEFRVPEGVLPQYKTSIGNIKVLGNADVDNLPYPGIEVQIPDGNGGTIQRDVVLIDLDTGGVILEESASRMDGAAPKRLVSIDKSIGLITFIDADGDETNGIHGEVVLPGTPNAVDVNLTGRSVRALYRANGEWSVQVLKAPSVYARSAGKPGIAQYYVGGTPGGVGGNGTRIYFPWADADRKVTISEIWYTQSGDTQPRSMTDQTFIIQTTPVDALGPYIDITSVDPAATAFDFETYGYAARGVKGSSLAVRVLWNPNFLTLSNDATENIQRLEEWGRGWRETVTETFIQREGM